ncbi:TIGR01777 family protein [Gammaproteobacteria bacterium 45_16_T64]|nr:TIGR01777 family protein [Gammaproteobacteria bacterium 45_16_T64]
MSKHVLITGGTGFIGQRLCQYLLQQGHALTIFTRSPKKVEEKWDGNVAAVNEFEQLQYIEPVDWVINLAGEPIADKRWTHAQKHKIQDSRVLFTKMLIDALSLMPKAPECLISGSAIGYYGDCGNETCDESQPPAHDFAAQLCLDWEKSAQAIAVKGTRLSFLRIGLVLGKNGGALKKMMPAFKLGMGGRFGSGNQWMSWIHLDDVCRLIIHIANTPKCKGAFNGTAPNPVTNTDFTKALAKSLHRPSFMSVPNLLLKKALGESSNLLLTGQRVMPVHANASGFKFAYPQLDECLDQIIHPAASHG